MIAAPAISPDWTLGRLQEEYPGVELVLFAHFGIGSRERSGFSADESLRDLLRRHLVFDAERACRRLNDLAHEDQAHSVTAEELAGGMEADRMVVIDARAEEEYRRCRLPGSRFLSATTVRELKSGKATEVVAVCRDGSQAPSASRVLRAQGLPARHLRGGLEAWSMKVNPDFPVLFPLQEQTGRWYLLADERTLRFRREKPLQGRGWRVLDRPALESFDRGRDLVTSIPSLEMVISTPRTFALRGVSGELSEVVDRLPKSLRDASEWDEFGRTGDESAERRRLERVLLEEAPGILASHKGTVVVEDYSDRVVTLALGGGCAGCASARITTQRELAACLYRAVPLLDGVR